MSPEQHKQIARRAFEALMAGDLSLLQDLLASGAELHQCGFLEPIALGSILQGTFPRRDLVRDREVRLERMIAEEDLVALHWRTSGWYNDPDEPELNGKEVSFPSMTFIRFEAGKIAEIWNIQDTATLESQLR